MNPEPLGFSLRLPRETLAGCVWLARLVDKARLHKAGNLPMDYTQFLGHPRGVDGRFLRHFGLDRDSTIESLGNAINDLTAAKWFLCQDGVSEAAILSWNGIAVNLGRPGFPGETELPLIIRRFIGDRPGCDAIGSFFQAIEFDEGNS